MKKVLALVLALIMVCTMAMAVGYSSYTEEIDTEDFTLMTMNNVKVKVTAEKAKVTHTAPVTVASGDDVTTTYYADKVVIDGVTYYQCDKSIAQYKVVYEAATATDVFLTKADLSKGATKEAELAEGLGDDAECGDYVDDTYVIGGKHYVVGGKNLALLDDLFVTYGDEAKTVAHSFAKKAYGYNAANGKIISVACDNCHDEFEVATKVPAAYTGDVNASLIPGYFVLGLAETAPAAATTTNPDTGANDVIGVAAALAVVALVSGAAISLKK